MGFFTKKNDAFICEHCGIEVPPASKTCRNHCPKCLHSKHVDEFPGDRANECMGLLEPIGYQQTASKGLVIVFKCQRCASTTRNIALTADEVMPDDYDLILRLPSVTPS